MPDASPLPRTVPLPTAHWPLFGSAFGLLVGVASMIVYRYEVRKFPKGVQPLLRHFDTCKPPKHRPPDHQATACTTDSAASFRNPGLQLSREPAGLSPALALDTPTISREFPRSVEALAFGLEPWGILQRPMRSTDHRTLHFERSFLASL